MHAITVPIALHVFLFTLSTLPCVISNAPFARRRASTLACAVQTSARMCWLLVLTARPLPPRRGYRLPAARCALGYDPKPQALRDPFCLSRSFLLVLHFTQPQPARPKPVTKTPAASSRVERAALS